MLPPFLLTMAEWLRSRELHFCSQVRSNRTFTRYWSDFHTYAIWETGAFPGDGDRFVQCGDVEKKIAANRLLGFGEWAVGDDAVLTRHYFPLAFEWISGNRFALFGQASEPSHPLFRDSLHLLGRKTFSQFGAAK